MKSSFSHVQNSFLEVVKDALSTEMSKEQFSNAERRKRSDARILNTPYKMLCFIIRN